jgi:hypothetical protein
MGETGCKFRGSQCPVAKELEGRRPGMAGESMDENAEEGDLEEGVK